MSQFSGHEPPIQQSGIPYASWAQRVYAYLIDAALYTVVASPAMVGVVLLLVAATEIEFGPDGEVEALPDFPTTAVVLIVVGLGLGLAFTFWNYCYRQGTTGYSIGKGFIGIKVIRIKTGEPTGTWYSLLRQLVHYVDSVTYVGYLWPLWDQQRQTFADKIVETVVVQQRR